MTVEWPIGSPRILLTDCWLPNAGDALIAVAMDRIIKDVAPGAAVVHAAYGPPDVRAAYSDLHLVDPLETLLGTRWAPGSASGGAEFVAAADLVVSQGGGFLREGYQPWSRIDALASAQRLGIPIALLGQSIGTFHRAFARRDLGHLVKYASKVVVRDGLSRWSVLDLGADADRVTVGADFSLAAMAEPAFVHEATERSRAKGTFSAPAGSIGVVLSEHEVPGEVPARSTVAQRLLSSVLSRADGPLVLWSSAQGSSDDAEDGLALQRAFDSLSNDDRDRTVLVDGHLDAYDIVALAGSVSRLVSMRLHPALLATAQSIPAVLVMADGKTAMFDGSPMRMRVARGQATAELDAAVGRVMQEEKVDPARELGLLLDMAAHTRGALEDLVRAAAAAR